MKGKSRYTYWRGCGKPLLVLSLGGLFAGLCNGLLGAGGGIILVVVLSGLVAKDEESSRSVYANALLVMVPLSCLTLYRYVQSGSLDMIARQGSPWIFAGAALGGIAGGILLSKLKNRQTGKIFAVLTLISGILMITR